MSPPLKNAIIPAALINQKIYFLRGTRVMLDSDLAKLYGVPTAKLNQAVQRNRDRFPEDFMFKLEKGDLELLRSQIVISKSGGRGGRRYAPYVFTEQGVAMLSSVLRGQRAVQVNVAIMRTFVRLREMLTTHEELRRKIAAMEKRYDARFQAVFDTIARCCKHQFRRKKRSDFTPSWITRGSRPAQLRIVVNNRN
jgi:hypothetical protein